MKILIPTVFRTKYIAAIQWAAAKYHSALRVGGLEDTEATRVSAAVCVCVVLWYLIVAVQYIADLFPIATRTLTALVTTH